MSVDSSKEGQEARPGYCYNCGTRDPKELDGSGLCVFCERGLLRGTVAALESAARDAEARIEEVTKERDQSVIRGGTWVARAGLIQAKLDTAEARIRELEGRSSRIESQAETALTLLQRYVDREGHDCGAYGEMNRDNLYDLCTGCEENWNRIS